MAFMRRVNSDTGLALWYWTYFGKGVDLGVYPDDIYWPEIAHARCQTGNPGTKGGIKMAASFIYAATIFNQGPVKESIPVYAFDYGDPGDNEKDWGSYQLSIGELQNFEFNAKDNRGLTIVVPVPIAMHFFGMQAKYDKLWIFAMKDADYVKPLHTLVTLRFDDGITVTHKRHVQKGTFKISAPQQERIAGRGGLAMFTAEAVTLSF
jgi:hypothetical protein